MQAFHVCLSAEKTLPHIDFLLAFFFSRSVNLGSVIIPVAKIITIHNSCNNDKKGNENFGLNLEVTVYRPPTDSKVPQVKPKFYKPIAIPLSCTTT
jgi:hypothetical protein